MAALTTAQKTRALELAFDGLSQLKIAHALGCRPQELAIAADNDLMFRDSFARALDRGLDGLADSLIDMCDDDTIAAHVLRQKSDNIKWLLARRAAKRYGDRLDINVNQTIDLSGALIEARKRSPLLSAGNHTLSPISQETEYTELIEISHTDNQSVNVQPAAPGDAPDIFA